MCAKRKGICGGEEGEEGNKRRKKKRIRRQIEENHQFVINAMVVNVNYVLFSIHFQYVCYKNRCVCVCMYVREMIT